MSRTAEEIRADLDPANPHRQHWRERLLADVEPLLARVAELEAALANGINEQVEAELLARAETAEAERDKLRVENERLRANPPLPEWVEMLTPQSCENGKHPDWFVDSEHNHACPWCALASSGVAPTQPQRIFHEATHSTGICPRCGESVMRPGHWVTSDPERVNCSRVAPTQPQEDE